MISAYDNCSSGHTGAGILSEKEYKWFILNDIANSLNRKEPSLSHCLPKDIQHSLKDLHSYKLCIEHNRCDFFYSFIPPE